MAPVAAVVTVALALALGGCSVGGGSQAGGGKSATLVVTRDFGTKPVGDKRFRSLPAGPTVMRLLERTFKVTTTYGGRYVTSIAGFGQSQNPPRDWLFYVNGSEAPVGATGSRVRFGDRVQWDLHRWDALPASKAIVGAFPQPLRTRGARIVCVSTGSASCADARARLRAAGVPLSRTRGAISVVVGLARDLRPVGGFDLTDAPPATGVFARVGAGGELTTFDGDGERARVLPAGAGVVTAADRGGGTVWFVIGDDEAGARAAAGLLTATALADKFGVWVAPGAHGSLPDQPATPPRPK